MVYSYWAITSFSTQTNDENNKFFSYDRYAKVPKKKTWEFGFKKGNKKHWSKYELS